MNRIDRISSLLVQLQSRPIVNARHMADRFSVSLRTIYRDMHSLSQAGIPICAEPGVGYSLIDGYRLPPLMFTKEEAVAFLTAEKFIEELTDSENSNHFHQGMDKVRAVMATTDKDLLWQMDSGIAIYRNERLPSAKLPNLLQMLLGSISEKRAVRINYFTPSRGENTERTVEPVGVTYLYPHWHLYAYCHLRREYRDFRMDRIEQIEVTKEPFTTNHPSFKTLLEQLNEPLSLTPVVLQTDKATSLRMGDSKFFVGLVSEQEQQESVTLTFMSYSLEGMARWVLSNADKIRIIEPQELKEIIKEIIFKIKL